MKLRFLSGAFALALSATAAFADGIMVSDPYARTSTMMSKSGAAFMVLMNHTHTDDTLIAARSDVAERVELHTHIADENGVMKMREVEGGIPVAAHGETALERGGLHVMFLGLNRSLEQGDMIDVVLVFEHAGEVAVQIPVDLERQPKHGMTMDHSNMDHSNMDHSTMDHGESHDGHADQDDKPSN